MRCEKLSENTLNTMEYNLQDKSKVCCSFCKRELVPKTDHYIIFAAVRESCRGNTFQKKPKIFCRSCWDSHNAWVQKMEKKVANERRRLENEQKQR